MTSIEIPESVTEIGSASFSGCTGLTSVVFNAKNCTSCGSDSYPAFPSTITELTIGNEVETIPDYAFYGCSGLTSVEIPESVTSIGSASFSGCTGLTSVSLKCPNIGSWFSGLTNIKEVVIGEHVSSIVSNAFKNCTGLTKAEFASIEHYLNGISFSGGFGSDSNPLYKAHHLYVGGSEVTNLVIPNSVTSIGGSAFRDCTSLSSVEIPNSVTSIGNYAFYGCSGLTSVTIGNSVTSIGGSAFRDCTSLSSVEIPNSVTSIGDYAFSDCFRLTSVVFNAKKCTSCGSDSYPAFPSTITKLTIGNEVETIPDYAFYGCSGLTSVTIGNSVTSIGEWAFNGCSRLTAVHISDIGAWCNIFFNDNPLLYAHHLYLNGKELEGNLVIPDGVSRIGNYAFYECSGLTSIEIPNSVTEIGDYAFYECSGLTSIEIPNSVVLIGSSAFKGCCKDLTSLIIPDRVESIGSDAFNGWTRLVDLTIGSGVTSIGSKAFGDSKIRQLLIKTDTPPSSSIDVFSEQTYYQTTLYVPIGKKDDYAYSDSWYKFNTIKESATANARATSEYAYTLMEVGTFSYAAYDAVNNRVKMVSSSNVDENNPNHCWQTVEVSGKKFLYNIGAKKFAVPTSNGSAFRLSENVGSISMEDGDDGIILGGNDNWQWALVIDEKMDADMSLEQTVATGVLPIDNGQLTMNNAKGVYDLSGRKMNVNDRSATTGDACLSKNVNDNLNSKCKIQNSKLRKGIYIVNGKKLLKR